MSEAMQIVSVGEILVDFVSTVPGRTLTDASAFAKCAGGAPANVAVGIAHLGTKSAYIGKVGDDPFGRFLVSEMRSLGVQTAGIRFDGDRKTRLAFASLKKDGDRDFEFWESQPADENLRSSDIDRRLIRKADVVNIGSFLLVKNPSRRTVMRTAQYARALGKEVCYDPNLRLSLWKNHETARRVMTAMIRRSTIVRLNDEEAHFFTRSRNPEIAARRLRKMGPRLVVITLGSKGCYFQNGVSSGIVEGFKVRAIDTIGCGDGFLAGLLQGLARNGKGLDRYTETELRSICVIANAVGALVATRRGGIAAMPSQKELRRFLRNKKVIRYR
jgi:fructokinase